MQDDLTNRLASAVVLVAGSMYGATAIAKTLYVEKFGQGTACSKPEPCPTIGDALAVATKNSKILIGPGDYREALVIDIEGIKLESTGGQYVTSIRTDRDTLIGAPTITVMANKVSIGRKNGKGLHIRSRNAPAIVAGTGLDAPTECDIDELGIFPVFDYSSGFDVEKLRVEGNIVRTELDSPYADNVPIKPIFSCSEAFEITRTPGEYLPTLVAHGPDIKVVDNVIHGEGTILADLSPVYSKVLFQDNLLKYEADTVQVDGFPSGGVTTFANSATIKGNAIYDWRDYPENWGLSGDGIFASGSSARISKNLVEGFSYGIAAELGSTIDKNVVRYVNWVGIGSFGGKKVADNTVAFDGGVSETFAGIVVDSMAKNSSVSGNTVTSLSGTGIAIHNAAPHGLYEGGQLKTFRKNNVYSTGYNLNRCGVRIDDAGTPFKMEKTFFGDNSDPLNLPEILDPFETTAATGIGDAICVTSGMFDTATGVIENVQYDPTNKPNKVKAFFTSNYY
ncbi:MAG: hypothetical protein HKN85_01560 [Gammaproteobacteria bacterium]|nr:hypothetical protein [Gammaproteobacteria bacterium]